MSTHDNGDESRFCWLTSLLVCKLILAVTIVVLLLTPINIRRESLKSTTHDVGDKKFDRSFFFGPHHHFCTKPVYHETPDANNATVARQLLDVLDLPEDSAISHDLTQLARCLLESRSTAANPNTDMMCMCSPKSGYIALILISCVSIVVNFAHVFAVAVLKRYEGSVAFFECILLSGTVAMATVDHVIWSDDVWLPDRLYEQSYFRKPTAWTVAVICSYFYVALAAGEFFCLDPMRYADSLDAENRPVTDWSVEDEPPEATQRLLRQRREANFVLICKPQFQRSWP